MRALALSEYTVAGAASGAIFTALGASILRPANPDTFRPAEAAVAGFIGGAVTHGAIGLLASLEKRPAIRDHLWGIGRSLPLAAFTSGVLGSAILGAAGYQDQPPPGAMILSGLLGGVLVGTVAGLGTTAALLCCLPRPHWAVVATGDLGRGEHIEDEEAALIHAEEEESAPPHHLEEHRRHGGLGERLLPFQHHRAT